MEKGLRYSLVYRGKQIVKTLPFDPAKSGLKFKRLNNCCLIYWGKNIQVRIKKAVQNIIVEQRDGDEIKGRPLLEGVVTAKSQEEFDKIISKCQ